MPKKSVFQSAAELLAYIYDDMMLSPLPEERELLLHAGNESPEALFDVCRLIFGANMNIAFRKTCVHMANYCDSLLEHADELFQESKASIMIDDIGDDIAAVEYLAEHAPMDSIDEKAVLSSLAYQSRSCYNQLRKQYRSYIRSFNRKRT